MTATKKFSYFVFRLKKGSGPHYELNPNYNKELPEDEDNPRFIEIKPGECVKSNRDLSAIFPNKFDLVESVVDVTSQFKGASSIGVTVLFNGASYSVVETSNGNVMKDGLSSSNEVLDYLKKLVES